MRCPGVKWLCVYTLGVPNQCAKARVGRYRASQSVATLGPTPTIIRKMGVLTGPAGSASVKRFDAVANTGHGTRRQPVHRYYGSLSKRPCITQRAVSSSWCVVCAPLPSPLRLGFAIGCGFQATLASNTAPRRLCLLSSNSFPLWSVICWRLCTHRLVRKRSQGITLYKSE